MSKAIEVLKKYWKVFASVAVLVLSALLFRRAKYVPTTAGESDAEQTGRENSIKNQVQDSTKVNEAISELNRHTPAQKVEPSDKDSMDDLVDRYNKL